MDPYKELGVSPDASDEEIKTAYRNLVKKYHPDRYASAPKDVQDQVSEKVKRINTAYDEIKKMRAGGGSGQSGYGYSGSYGSYGSYGGYGQQSAGGGYASSEQFQDIREMIRRGLIMQAAEALNRIQNHTAEWYYLSGLVYMRQGMYSRAQQAFQTAANMEPGNEEYRQAAEQMSGVYQQTHTRTMGGNNDLLCNICQCMACMSLCGGGRLFCCC
ncbi:MAG: DnaJ domain-containing protein [Candidatus Spyradocola sp.]